MPTEIQGLEILNVTLGRMLGRVGNMRPILTEIAQKQVSSFQENFIQGGRPRWEPSIRVKKHGGKTLLLTGHLMKSITVPQVTNTTIAYGSNLPYAAIHQFGGEIRIPARTEMFQRNRYVKGPKKGMFKRGTREGRGFTIGAYTVDMPARPYITFGPKDISDTGSIILGHLLGQS